MLIQFIKSIFKGDRTWEIGEVAECDKKFGEQLVKSDHAIEVVPDDDQTPEEQLPPNTPEAIAMTPQADPATPTPQEKQAITEMVMDVKRELRDDATKAADPADTRADAPKTLGDTDERKDGPSETAAAPPAPERAATPKARPRPAPRPRPTPAQK